MDANFFAEHYQPKDKMPMEQIRHQFLPFFSKRQNLSETKPPLGPTLLGLNVIK